MGIFGLNIVHEIISLQDHGTWCYGMASDVQLVSYILENCVALQKLIIDPAISKSRRLSIGSAEYKLEYEKTGRENAKQQLEALVPRHIELVIL